MKTAKKKAATTTTCLAFFWGCFLASPSWLPAPAHAEPCLSEETLTYVKQKMGEIPAGLFIGATGLGLCAASLNDDTQRALQQIEELNAQAERDPERTTCSSTSGLASSGLLPGTSSGRQSLLPEEAIGSASTSGQVCSCSKQKEALRIALEALKRRAQ